MSTSKDTKWQQARQGQKEPEEGGVVLLVNEEIKVDECEALNSAKFQESVWCVLHISSTCKLLVGVCYRPPNSLKENNEELLRLMDLLKAVHVTDYLIMGDFNYREIDWAVGSVGDSADSDASQFFF